MDIYDPNNCDNLKIKQEIYYLKKCDIKENCENFPIDDISRHFSELHYTRILPNGESQYRKRLVYSKSVDKLYSFRCKLFESIYLTSDLANEGYNY